jgi:hypothetical protein
MPRATATVVAATFPGGAFRAAVHVAIQADALFVVFDHTSATSVCADLSIVFINLHGLSSKGEFERVASHRI